VRETQLGVIILFAIGTGLRRGELVGLRWTDFDDGDGLTNDVYKLQRAGKNVNGKPVVGPLKTAKSARTDIYRPSFSRRSRRIAASRSSAT
jgi:integrase